MTIRLSLASRTPYSGLRRRGAVAVGCLGLRRRGPGPRQRRRGRRLLILRARATRLDVGEDCDREDRVRREDDMRGVRVLGYGVDRTFPSARQPVKRPTSSPRRPISVMPSAGWNGDARSVRLSQQALSPAARLPRASASGLSPT